MIVVIIAGGSGTRLWPLSTHDKPKQVVGLLGETSLIQNTYSRAKELTDKVFILTELSHAHIVIEQIPDLPKENFIIEPARRGTASCIIAALDQIARKYDKDEPVVFMSADHQIRDVNGFVASFKIAEEASKKNKKIVLVGVEPTYPAVGFGYIEKGKYLDGVYEVGCFKEKPDHKTAQEYLLSGKYSWNAGYFVGSYTTFQDQMSKVSPKLKDMADSLAAIKSVEGDEYEQAYLEFESDSIDFALIEKVQDLLMVPATFDWVDVGSYKDLHEVSPQDEQGNYIKGKAYIDEVENSFIRNEEDKPIAILGVDNIVVVNTPKGILVARKDLSKNIGTAAKEIQKEE